MKIKKIAVLGALAAVAGASIATGLTSCGEKADPTGLDIHLNYTGKQGISLRDPSFNNAVENTNYVKGDLLPVWKAYSKAMGVTFRDAASYGQGSDNDTFTTVQNLGYKSETSAVQLIDLWYNSTANIEKAGGLGEVEDLTPYIDAGKMPNFKKFLDANPTIKKTITKGGKIYYTPYFDGYQAIERMFVMDTAMVAKILDEDTDTNAKDTAATQGTTTTVGVRATKDGGRFQPFMNDTKNYPDATTTVKISKNGVASNLVLNQTDNIIAQQNAKLATGVSGQELRKQLRDYIKAVLGNNYGEGKTFTKLSEFYTSEHAAYNADDLIALMRVVKASSELITGDANTEIQIMIPRGQANNRVDNIADLIKAFGIQGMDGEKDMLYYDGDGHLNDAASTKQSYQAYDMLAQLYAEGLILTDFNIKADGNGTLYLNKYFGHTTDNPGYGFMMYDYSASTCAMNTKVDGVGTDNSKRKGAFKDQDYKGMMPVLSPLSYWATETGWNAYTADIDDFSKKTLVRYEESNRALKSNSWCVPSSADNKETAVKLMDYLFSNEGKLTNDFGPEDYWKDKKIDGFSYAGEKTPQFSDTFKTMISSSSTDFWSFLRGYLGATHGIGYVRSATINYLATNKYAQEGTANIENSIASTASVLCKVDNTIKYATSVPTAGYASISAQNQEEYAAVTAFWAADKCSDDELGWVKLIKNMYTVGKEFNETTVLGKAGSAKTDYTLTMVQNQIEKRAKVYLFTMANSYNAAPDYAKPVAA